MSFFLLFLIAALSLRSFDGRRQCPADMAGLEVCDSLRLSAANLKIYW